MPVNPRKEVLKTSVVFICRCCCSNYATLPESRQTRARVDKEEGQAEANSDPTEMIAFIITTATL